MVSVAGGIIITILILALIGIVGWIIFTQLRARRLGLPPPSLSSYLPFRKSEAAPSYGPPRPAPSGISGWFNDKISSFKNRGNRSAAGAYEQPSGDGAPRRGFGPLDPDEAWDARVGHEAETYGPYGNYEEQELEYRGGSRGADGGNSYNMNLAATPGLHHDDEPARGRSLSRLGDDDARLGGPKSGGRNPFEDDAEPSNISLRGVSPRPIVDTASQHQQKENGESPTERRSIFRENV
ncbi:hypothetical protein LX32DRAFT_135968 [Colletotrichum zoysiae]|uniref:Acid phosphatase-like protein n=1 Tax=Colletotrichum zoysiae TaxID=1216348 RepID=A0AAD9LZ30_9PEZI|nr:hypothetical protein LX32DRAFT_135968 [Colletotrichum zoysiae]